MTNTHITHYGITIGIDTMDWRNETASSAAADAMIDAIRALSEYDTIALHRELRTGFPGARTEEIETGGATAARAAGGFDGNAGLYLPKHDYGGQDRDAARADVLEASSHSIEAAKARFAAAHDMSGASRSAITKAWKRAGKPA
jgi:D-tyrosyl-tRNA(Tyr) deacylase